MCFERIKMRWVTVASVAIVTLCVAIQAQRPVSLDREPLEVVIDLANKFSDKFLGITAGDIRNTSVQSPLLNFLSLSTLSWGTVGSRRELLMKGLGFSDRDHRILKSGIRALIDQLDQSHGNMEFHLNSESIVPSQLSPNPPDIKLFEEFYRSDKPRFCIHLATSVDLRGPWATEFDTSRTQSRLFYVYGNAPVDTPTMYARGMFRYGKLKEGVLTFIELPYKSQDEKDAISLFIIRPNDRSPQVYQQLINDFSTIDIEKLGEYPKVDVELYLPRLDIKTGFPSSEWIPRFFQPGNPFDSKDVASIIVPSPFEFKDIYNEISILIDERGGSSSALSADINHKARASRSVPERPVEKFEVNIPFVGIVATTGSEGIKFLYFTVSGSRFVERKRS